MVPPFDVVMPLYNRADTVGRVLAELEPQCAPTDRVIVVDDGSTDGGPSVVRACASRWRSPVVLHACPHGGPAAARNLGVAAGSASLLLFLGADCVPAPTLLARHRAVHAQFPEEAVGCLGWVSWDPELPPSPLMVWSEHGGHQNAYGLIAGETWANPLSFAYGANLSVKRALFERVGGFDAAHFREYGWEDLDLGMRLTELGFRLRYEPTARAWHVHRQTFADLWERQEATGRGLRTLQKLHPDVLPALPRSRLAAVCPVVPSAAVRRPAEFLVRWLERRWILPRLYASLLSLPFTDSVQSSVAAVDNSSLRVTENLPALRRHNVAFESQKTLVLPESHLPSSARSSASESTGSYTAVMSIHPKEHEPLSGLAVVVVHWGQPAVTRLTLERLRSLYPTTHAPRVLVVENGPPPVAADGVTVETLALPENRGYGAAANAGIREAFRLGAATVLLLNNDVVVPPGFLEALCAALRSPSAGLVGAVLQEPRRRVYGGGMVRWVRWQTELCDFPLPVTRLDYLHGACLGIARRCWEAVGPFREDLFLYWEDVDFGLRAKARGLGFARVDAPPLVHHASAALGEASAAHLYYLVRNAIPVLSAQGPPWARWWARAALPLREGWARGRGKSVVARALRDARHGRLGPAPKDLQS